MRFIFNKSVGIYCKGICFLFRSNGLYWNVNQCDAVQCEERILQQASNKLKKRKRTQIEKQLVTLTESPSIVQETRAQIWPNLAMEYICRFMIDSLYPDSFLFKSAGCQTVNFGHFMLYAFEK